MVFVYWWQINTNLGNYSFGILVSRKHSTVDCARVEDTEVESLKEKSKVKTRIIYANLL